MEAIPILRWLAVLAVLWAAGLPVAAALFPRFPDRGASLALPASLLVVSVVAYWVGQVRFGPVAVGAGVVVVAGAAWVAIRRGATVHPADLREPVAVFLVGFCFLVVLRGGVPAITPGGGEQFLDFALLNAVLRAETLPPEDPWFAGRRVRYYYGGYLSTAVVAGVSGVRAGIAFNLGIATAYATLVTAAYGLTAAVADATGVPRRIAGGCGAYLVGFAGNLATPGRLLLGLVPDALGRRYGRVLIEGIRRAPDYESAYRAATDLSTFDFWRARHVIPDVPTVFPFWTFLNGDLRPHMLSAPFLLLVVACCFTWLRTPADRRRRRRGMLFGVLPVAAGYLGLVNTWSLPTAVGLVGLTVALGEGGGSEEGGSERNAVEGEASRTLRIGTPGGTELRRVAVGAASALAVGGLALLWIAPYLLSGTATNDGIGLFPPRSDLGGLALVYGLFLCAFGAYLAPRLWTFLTKRDRSVYAGVAVGLAALVAGGLLAGFPALSLLGPFLVAGWVLVRSDADVGFETVLIVAGAGLLLVVELVYARVWPHDPAVPRWNTVYKVSMQAWILWGVGGGVALAAVLPSLGEAARRVPGDRQPRDLARVAALAILVGLLASAGTVGVVTSAGWVQEYAERPGATNTLDGTAHLATNHSGEAAAIDWLRDREGTATLVTAPGDDDYDWRAAPATMTGHPTVVGWEHVAGYHGRAAYERRVADVDRIYTGDAATRRRLLTEYGVDYVYVGPVERERYGTVSFDGVPGVRPVHRSGNVTIYAVDPGEDSEDRRRPAVEGSVDRTYSVATPSGPRWR